MIEELYIAEKPSVGKAIAENLGGPIQAVKGDNGRPTHYLVGNKAVTWGFGHILEQAMPEDYNSAFSGSWMKSSSLLPVIPEKWRLKPVPSAKDQLDVIKFLLGECRSVVHAGDPDREGQLLIDEVLEYLGNKKPVMRILPNAIDNKSMKRILANMVDNKQYLGLYHAGLARSRGDWLVGMNMTRACTTANQRGGMTGVLSVGRVQTPTLAIIVRRDLEIDNFKSQTYFELAANFKHAKGNYTGKWLVPKGYPGVDKEGRLTDPVEAAKIKKLCDGKAGNITEYKVENQSQSPPLPYSLSTLQVKASEALKMGAKQVLDVCQSLYDKKIASYPRTDSQYLPEDQWELAESVLASISQFDPSMGKFARDGNSKLKGAVWNSKKVIAHHAIVPTGEVNFNSLTEPERQIFTLIAKQFIAQFYPDYTYSQTSVRTACEGYEFRSSGRTPIDMGWRKVLGAEESSKKSLGPKDPGDASKDQALPPMRSSDPVQCALLSSTKKQTKAPARYNEGTLIRAMTNVHETVSDPELKKKLKEVKGIGTEATRSEHIETLKKRQFASAEIERGCLISTPAGKALIAALPKDFTDVTMTALWENASSQIERGTMTLDRFMEGQTQWIKTLTKAALEMKISVAVGLNSAAAAQFASAGAGSVCPGCGKGTMGVREAKKGPNAGQFFLACSAYPVCKQTAQIEGQNDAKKKPAAAKRPSRAAADGDAGRRSRSND